MSQPMEKNESGIEKAAIFMMSIGSSESAEILKHFGPRDVNRLLTKMTQLKDVKQEQINNITREFIEESTVRSGIGTGSNDYIKNMLNQALGEEKAGFLADRVLQTTDTAGIESLKWMEPGSVSELIKNEHPQIIATILVYLERDHAAAIMNCFDDRLRKDVMIRISKLEGVQPSALRELNEVLSKVLSGGEKVKKHTLGGTKTAAEILNFVGSVNEQAVIESIREYDNDLAQAIQDEMFVFDNLMDIDDRGLQIVLREVENSMLVVALKGTPESLRERLFSNMSTRAADAVREELANRGPMRLSEVDTAQKEILKVVRRLAEEGQVIMGGGGEDAFV